MSSGPAVEAIHLVKHFGETVAVDDVSFEVPQGTVLGLLGPNGAGKTTTVRMMTTLSRPTSGTARVAGHDVLTEPDAVRRSMGLTGQSATVDELLTGRENLALISALYGLDKATARRVGGDLLDRFSLSDASDRVVKTYSGGMRRRIDLAVNLVATPPVLFLDEPTTGLDPRSRVELWEVLRALVRDGAGGADHAVPRGGRPAGRRDRGHRPLGRSPGGTRSPPWSRPSVSSGATARPPLPTRPGRFRTRCSPRSSGRSSSRP